MIKYLKFFVILLFAIVVEKNNLYSQQSGLGLFINKMPLSIGASSAERLDVHPVVERLPLFGKSLRKKGSEIPLPFGIGITGFYYTQKFVASSLQLTSVSPITGDTIHARPDTLIQDTRAGEMQMVIKPDVWLLPFLNIYGIIGYTQGTINPNLIAPKIIVEFPGIGEQIIDTTITIHDNLPYYGHVLGGGLTVAIGIGNFFFSADYHYTETYPTDLEGKLIYHVFSPKAGIVFSFSRKIKLDLWTGAMYFSNKQTMYGQVKVSDFSKTLAKVIGDNADYVGNIQPIHRWNVLAGAVLEVNNHHRFLVEGGFIHRTQLKMGYEFRF